METLSSATELVSNQEIIKKGQWLKRILSGFIDNGPMANLHSCFAGRRRLGFAVWGNIDAETDHVYFPICN
jgi:hypothetical protein